MKYLTAEEVLILHSEIIDQTGGSHGIRDIGLLMSIIEKPKATFGGKELYKGVFNKASATLEAFVQYHVFIDGNKRSAALSASRFLFINGYDLTATNKELEKFMVKVAVEKSNLNEISLWLKKHSKKTKPK
ncbi:MAG: type II toxin-antitoxin system death-on-curing family toxin [bacterium]|nr:type II toxin-antitoxin system death-on-curing family toxin [bacterium]